MVSFWCCFFCGCWFSLFFFGPLSLVNVAPAFYLEKPPRCVTQDRKEHRVKDRIRLVCFLPVI